MIHTEIQIWKKGSSSWATNHLHGHREQGEEDAQETRVDRSTLNKETNICEQSEECKQSEHGRQSKR